MFKAEDNWLSTIYIPTKQIKSRADLPWITHEIVKLIRKRDKLYTKLNRSCSQKSHYTEKINISSQPYKNRLEMHTGLTISYDQFSFLTHKVLVTRKGFTTLLNTKLQKTLQKT